MAIKAWEMYIVQDDIKAERAGAKIAANLSTFF
jgi:hypothetical protein